MLKDFVQKHDLSLDATDRQFEKFANYCLMRTDHYDSFEFEKVSTGDCIGVDGVAVSIGGVIVNELDDAQIFTKGQFDAKFIFAQAKTSSKFDLGDFLKFVTTVKVFFGRDVAAIPAELQKAFKIKSLVYERAAKLRQAPTVELSYVYSGRFQLEGSQIEKQIENEIQAIRAMPYLFSDVTWHIHDGDAIARLYRETQNDIQKDIPFQRHVALPHIRGARAAYLGVASCQDYVRIIQKENGELNKGLFFENVRDFLGDENSVNQEIAKTINDHEERDRFALLNNGVTIVARSVTPSGDTFKLSQFQVVNGCQTSHMLFNNKDAITDDMYVTVKLIETSDVDLSGKIIATTNSQSHVNKEAFATIRPYHRSLEDFFNAMRSTNYEYYYERRPHQYDDRDDIRQSRIASAPSLIQAFVSVVLEEPHKIHYYYGRLLIEYNQNRNSELFAEDDYPGLYFAAYHIVSRTRLAIGKNREMKDWLFHLALLIKRQISPELQKGSALTDKKFLEILKKIDAEFDAAYIVAAKVVEHLRLLSDENRAPKITEQLLEELYRALKNAKQEQKILVLDGERSSEKLLLVDGHYIGQIDAIDAVNRRVMLRYGPYQVDASANLDSDTWLRLGGRVPFKVEDGMANLIRPE
ncbi:AIPR family protein [Variovorax sp. W2I14]|uniref:AIPR family protein n=1 Tax=Variovorax sp. W2I14 TaxID=3042290 RepID=UPI003D19A16C